MLKHTTSMTTILVISIVRAAGIQLVTHCFFLVVHQTVLRELHETPLKLLSGIACWVGASPLSLLNITFLNDLSCNTSRNCISFPIVSATTRHSASNDVAGTIYSPAVLIKKLISLVNQIM